MTADMLIADIAYRGARMWPDHVALRMGERDVTYRELAETVTATAGFLYAEGVRPGDRVAILSTNTTEALEAYLALSLCGAVGVPLNIRLTADDIRYQVDDAQVSYSLFAEPLRELAEGGGLLARPHACLDDVAARHTASSIELPDRAELDAGAPYIQLYTSGTTGRPKGCLLSQRAWIASNGNLAHALAVGPEHRLLAIYPFFHVAGFGLALTHLQAGGRVIIPTTATPDKLWELVADERLTTIGLPGMRHMLSNPRMADLDLSAVTTVFAGANVEGPKTLDLLEERLPGARYVGVYGCTEGGNFVTISSADDERQRPGSVGRPLLGFDVAMMDGLGREVEPGEVGELCLRGPSTMLGYWNLPDETAQTMRDGWIRTGDLMKIEDGCLVFVDRAKDMIKSGGENVYSLEVEKVLFAHPDVIDAAVIGVPDDKWSEAVKGLIVLRQGSSVTASDLDEFCRARLAGYKRPRLYEFLDDIPRSQTQKVLKRDLRAAHGSDRSIRV